MKRRQRAGQARAIANGDALESDLDQFHARLSIQGWYVQPKWPKGPQRTKGPPDYLLIGPDRTPVLFDAKSTQAAAWPVLLLAPHQFTALDRFPGVAGVYLRLSVGDRWIPFSLLGDRWTRAYQSQRPDYLTAADGIPVVGMDWTAHVIR